MLVVAAVSLTGAAPATSDVAALRPPGSTQGTNPSATGAAGGPASAGQHTGTGSGKTGGKGSPSSGSTGNGGSGGTGGLGGSAGSGAIAAPQSSAQAASGGSAASAGGAGTSGGTAANAGQTGAAPSTGTTATTSAAAKPTYTAVAGLDCTGSSTATYSDSEGYYTDGDSGWLRPTDGYAGSGCTGKYDAVPMSGTAGLTHYDTTGFALYKWNFSGSFTDASCKLSIYVPDDTSRLHVGGDPTYYYYWAQNYSYGQSLTPSGDFSVTEVDDLGEWVTQPSFTVTTGYVTLKLVNSGLDWTSAGVDYAHHAAAAVKLSCTES
ncbi:hypothetical protein [Actinospica durhamensis]|uniref:hypothetical protein n=1 Tax=Actinospica durhamensis TaxID=1508375 RepID=UPI001BAA40F3|nr:hypothetical protein [Actinospica durhamensis]